MHTYMHTCILRARFGIDSILVGLSCTSMIRQGAGGCTSIASRLSTQYDRTHHIHIRERELRRAEIIPYRARCNTLLCFWKVTFTGIYDSPWDARRTTYSTTYYAPSAANPWPSYTSQIKAFWRRRFAIQAGHDSRLVSRESSVHVPVNVHYHRRTATSTALLYISPKVRRTTIIGQSEKLALDTLLDFYFLPESSHINIYIIEFSESRTRRVSLDF